MYFNKILLISHDASRSGAPLYIINFAKWLKNTHGTEVLSLIINGGDLEDEFHALGKTWLWDSHYTKSSLGERLLSKMGLMKLNTTYQKRIIKEISNQKPQIVFSNTIVSNKVASVLRPHLKACFISLVHEMQFSASVFYPEFISNFYLQNFAGIIAINNHIKTYLVNDFGYNNKRISVIPPFIKNVPTRIHNIPEFTKRHTKKDITIGFSGYADWQKGFDLFMPLIYILKNRVINKNINAIWLGDIPELTLKKAKYELSKLKMNKFCSFPGRVESTDAFYKKIDIFVSLSKEDSYPISCLEAASFGKPIIAFEGAGGVEDLILSGAGFLAPFLDLNGLAEKICQLIDDDELRQSTGQRAADIAKNYTINKVAPQIIDFVSTVYTLT